MRNRLMVILTMSVFMMASAAFAQQFSRGNAITVTARPNATTVTAGRSVHISVTATDTDTTSTQYGLGGIVNDPVIVTAQASAGSVTEQPNAYVNPNATSYTGNWYWYAPAQNGTYAVMFTARDSARFYKDPPTSQLVVFTVTGGTSAPNNTISLTSSPSTVDLTRATTNGTNSTLTARLSGSGTLSGQNITFWTSGGILQQGPTTTDATGVVTLDVSMGVENVGTVTAYAFNGPVGASTRITVLGNSAANPNTGNINNLPVNSPGVTVTVTPTNVPADGISRALIHVQLQDQGGMVLSNRPVIFATTAGQLRMMQGITDSYGNIDNEIMATTQTGPAIITINAGGLRGNTMLTFTPIGNGAYGGYDPYQTGGGSGYNPYQQQQYNPYQQQQYNPYQQPGAINPQTGQPYTGTGTGATKTAGPAVNVSQITLAATPSEGIADGTTEYMIIATVLGEGGGGGGGKAGGGATGGGAGGRTGGGALMSAPMDIKIVPKSAVDFSTGKATKVQAIDPITGMPIDTTGGGGAAPPAKALQNVPVMFTTTAGKFKLNKNLMYTAADGRAITYLIAPDKPSVVTVTATAGTTDEFTTTVTLIFTSEKPVAAPIKLNPVKLDGYSGMVSGYVSDNLIQSQMKTTSSTGVTSAAWSKLTILDPITKAPKQDVQLGASGLLLRDQYGITRGYAIEDNTEAKGVIVVLNPDGTEARRVFVPLTVGRHMVEVKLVSQTGNIAVITSEAKNIKPEVLYFSKDADTPVLTITDKPAGRPLIALTPDGNLAVANTDKTVEFYTAKGDKLTLGGAITDDLPFTSIAVSPTSNYIAVAVSDPKQTAIDPSVVVFSNTSTEPIIFAKVSPRSLAAAGPNGIVASLADKTQYFDLGKSALGWDVKDNGTAAIGGFDRFLAVGNMGVIAGLRNAKGALVSRLEIISLVDGKVLGAQDLTDLRSVVGLAPENNMVKVISSSYTLSVRLPADTYQVEPVMTDTGIF